MKKFNFKKIFIAILVIFSIFTSKAYAADKFFYWVDDLSNEFGIIGGTTGYISKAACENDTIGYKSVHPSHTKSNGCYPGGNVTITGFALDQGGTGKAGEYFTLTGDNFKKVTGVFLGSTKTDSVTQTDLKSIRVQVPSRAVSGKITVKTNYRGSATSSKEFVVGESPLDTNPWAYLNIQKQYNGPYKTEAECEGELKKYLNDPANGITAAEKVGRVCTQRSVDEIKKSQVLNFPNNNPIQQDAAQDLGVKDVGVSDPETYKLLAPLPGIEGGIIKTNDLGNYFNMMFKLIIGLCGALAVIMIIIGGVQYMGDESVFGKTEAKSKITSAILGLLIALGAFALLNTINPALTGQNGLTVDQIDAQIDEESEPVENVGTYSTTGGNVKICTSGFTDVVTFGSGTVTSPRKINICRSLSGITLADNLQKMINDAKNAGIVLSGWGSRSYDTQVQLRKDHHCADIYNSSPKTCKPPTARPGKSNHEVGGAVDFTCNGIGMTASGGRNSVCFKWLAAHAADYKFKNLPSEPWHWSFNGR